LQTHIEQHAQKRRAILHPINQEWQGILPETRNSGHVEEKHCDRQKQPASQDRPQMYQHIDRHVFHGVFRCRRIGEYADVRLS